MKIQRKARAKETANHGDAARHAATQRKEIRLVIVDDHAMILRRLGGNDRPPEGDARHRVAPAGDPQGKDVAAAWVVRLRLNKHSQQTTPQEERTQYGRQSKTHHTSQQRWQKALRS